MFRRKQEESTVTITATEALAQSEKALADAEARWPEVREVVGSLRTLRHRNHFSEMIEESFRGKHT